MVFLLLSILTSTSIFIVFKLINRHNINAFSTIIINYIVACSAGFFLSKSNPFTIEIFSSSWIILSVILGFIFITMFRLIGQGVQKVGVSTTTVAAKMSVIIPIIFTLAIEPNDRLTSIKIVGILLALGAIFLATFKPARERNDLATMVLPLLIFVGIGILDSLVKYAQYRYVSNELTPLFSGITFGFAGLTGILLLPFNPSALKDMGKLKTWLLGVLLGLGNFGSMYFFIKALNYVDGVSGKGIPGSIIFGINNICIVTLGVLIGFGFYKERPTKLNWIGISLSIIAIVVLTYGQI